MSWNTGCLSIVSNKPRLIGSFKHFERMQFIYGSHTLYSMFVHFRCYKEFTYFASPGQERLKVDEGALAEVLREEGVEEVLEEASSEALESWR